ncbi:type I pantothenate kinase [Kroppenstedtia pulmonis]|uniref:Pantothenate kinase n=1 Tax=Kroppenstedtia pulmonis TaxID=1380685 RepID=A0A7D4B1R0_9BACL|nr:type I pantothenate kinase [Kroppenstedtia pulmonis]QKG83866.1 type I pantothenate kinase [Kroppenstedtia pulmonis]
MVDALHFSPYISFSREEWKSLRASVPLTLTQTQLDQLRGINERISLEDVSDIYLPLSRLLNLYVANNQDRYRTTQHFLGKLSDSTPYIIGIAGSVAVGKSTTARILQALLARWPNHPKVDLVTTDGFLYPNAVLKKRGLMNRKGFPESYRMKKLIRFLSDVKAGRPEVEAPVYSHLVYDVIQNQVQRIKKPDILIVEGLNVLQTFGGCGTPSLSVSDFFDFSIYVDADERDIARWYVERFQVLRKTAFQKPESYFHRYASLTSEEAVEVSSQIWKDINGINLVENILPTRPRAHLILKKGSKHTITGVKLRKL